MFNQHNTKYNTEEICKLIKTKFGNSVDTSEVVFKSTHKEIKVYCKIHNEYIYIKPSAFIHRKRDFICLKCKHHNRILEKSIKPSSLICRECGLEKKVENMVFRKLRNVYDNLCIDCNRIISREHRIKNKKDINRRRRESYKERYNNDINFKLGSSLRNRIRMAIKNQYSEKSYKTIELLGCSIERCREWLESKFLPNMSWENYGEWQVDHILPCSSFNLNNLEEQLRCFHYTNLQPMWAFDNMSKYSKVEVLTSEGIFIL